MISSMLEPASRFSKTVATGIRELRNTHAPLRFPGMLSTAWHCDQSRFAMFLPPFMVAGYVVFYHGWAASSRVSLPKKLPHPNPHFHRINPWIRIAQPRIRNMQIPQLQTESMFIAEQMHPQRSRGSKVHTRSSRRNLMIGEEYPTP